MTKLIVLRRQVRNRIGVPVTDGFHTDDRIDDAINAAISSVEAEARWPWQETVATPTTVADTETLTMPSDWRVTRSIHIGDDELYQRSPSDLYTWNDNDRGRPQIWTLVGGQVRLRPIPDQAYDIVHIYYKQPTVVVDDNDEPDMPTHFTEAIIAKAAELLAIREDDRAAASAHLAEYMGWVQRMRKATRLTTKPVRIRVREGSWI